MAIMHTVQEQTAPDDSTTTGASSASSPDPAPEPDDTTSAPHRDA